MTDKKKVDEEEVKGKVSEEEGELTEDELEQVAGGFGFFNPGHSSGGMTTMALGENGGGINIPDFLKTNK